MLRMGKLTDYATVVLASLAQEPARHRAATELAERTRLSRPTVSKVLKGLQRAGMVISSAAPRRLPVGALAREDHAAQILDVFEGPIAITSAAAPRVSAALSASAGSAAPGSGSTPGSGGRSRM